MNRSPSYFAQAGFDIVNRLQYRSIHSARLFRLFARAANKLARPIAKKLGANHTVNARLYGHPLVMPAEHPLAFTLQAIPQYNRPLGLAIAAIATSNDGDSLLTVIDVGANIGDTVAIIEQRRPNICSYLCIEADQNLAELCKLNHHDNNRVQVEQCFIGENEGSLVRLEDDGHANPSTKVVANAAEEPGYGRLLRLDTVASQFAENHGCLSLIKVDTEGYDFSVLRSGSALLGKYKPDLYFEWFPRLLTALNEEVWSGFEYLESFGYHHFVLFTNQGDYYRKISNPDRALLRNLTSVAEGNEELPYFDIFASTSELTCDKLVELSTSPDTPRAS